MPTKQHPTIGDAALFQFAMASAYALLIFVGNGHPDTIFGMAIEKWIGLFVPAVQVLFALVPIPAGIAGNVPLDEIGAYRHILAACILFACIHFLYSRRHWSNWSQHIKGCLSATCGSPENRFSTALTGFRRMILGVIATLFLALFVEAQAPTIGGYLYRAGWTYVRAPLLLAAAYSFACRAVALRSLLTERH